MAGPGNPAILSAAISVDPRTLAKKLSFNRPVTPAECSTYLFGNASRVAVCQPAGIAMGGKYREFMLDTRNVETVMSMRNDIRNAIVQASVLTSVGDPYDLPKWVPAAIQQDVRAGRIKQGVTRYPTQGEWGDIVVWKGNVSIQLYQEFPAAKAYYDRIDGDRGDGHLLHFAYTQYNQDMKYFVEQRGMSPDDARAEIRRINDEVFKLVLGAAATIMSSGAATAQVMNAMRASASQVTAAVRRSPRYANKSAAGASSGTAAERIVPLNGKVNVGGGGGPLEPAGYTNLNPIKPGSGGPSSGIANHLQGSMEEMAELMQPQSVGEMISNRLRFIDVNWARATAAAARVMKPGGKVSMNVWCTAEEAAQLRAAFKSAGFRDVETVGSGTGTMLTAVR
jgi:hypothetical protein